MLITTDLIRSVRTRFSQIWIDPRNNHEVVECTDSLALLIHIEDQNKFVLLVEERLAMRTEENPAGKILGLVAGRFDNNQTPMELAVQEAREECGADITGEQIEFLNHGQPLGLSPGIITERSYLAFARIHSNQLEPDRVFGLADENEKITRLLVTLEELRNMTYDDVRVMTLVLWYLQNKVGGSYV